MAISELLTQLGVVVNIALVLFLLAVGYCIKHTPALDKVSNNLIPVILVVLGAVVGVLTKGDTTIASAIVNGIINAAIAIAIHQSGKNIFEIFAAKTMGSDDIEQQ